VSYSRQALILVFLASNLSLDAVAWPGDAALTTASGCVDLAEIPIRYGMQYDLPNLSGLPNAPIDIYDIWLASGCVGCHNVSAAGGLRLNQPWFVGSTLIGRPSTRLPDVLRVNATKPNESLLFAMLNCTPPAPYPTMPLGGAPIPPESRALVYDWIAQGARAVGLDGNPVSDVIFKDNFESQRFQQNLLGTLTIRPTPSR
jgi:hypothetical protein